MLNATIVPKLAFELLQETENLYKGHKKLPTETLTQLHSFFGPTLSQATELLETCKITQYETKDKTRSIYKVGMSGFPIASFTRQDQSDLQTCVSLEIKPNY